MSIGERIKHYRKSNKMTQRDLARLIGKSESLIIKYEKDITTPPIESLNQIANVFKVTTMDLMTDTDKFGRAINRMDLFENLLKECEFTFLYKQISEDNYEIDISGNDLNVTILDSEYEELLNKIKRFIIFELSEINYNKERNADGSSD